MKHNMSPQQLAEFNDMKKRLEALETVRNISFVKELERRLDITGKVSYGINQASINDLSDVDITSVSNGQVLKYTTTGVDRWVNGTDNV
jgi:hypothetical protein